MPKLKKRGAIQSKLGSAGPAGVSSGSSKKCSGFNSPETRWIHWCLLGLILLIHAALRIRLAAVPLERDEGEYAYQGQLILQGFAPFELAQSSQKLPGAYLIGALSQLIFGDPPVGLRLGLMVITTMSIVLIFLLARKFTTPMGAVFASASFAILNVSPGMLAMAAHATHFVVCPVLVGLLLVIRADQTRNLAWLAVAGVFFGLSVIARQPAVFFGVFGFGVWVASEIRSSNSVEWRRLALGASIFSACAALPLAFLVAWIWSKGAWSRFVFWTWEYAASYGSLTTLAQGKDLFSWSFPRVFAPNWPLWILAIVGVIGLVRSGTLGTRAFVGGLFLASALAVSAGLYFREHYFIQLIPLLALACGLAVGGSTGDRTDPKPLWLFRSLGVAAIIVTFALQSNWLLKLTPEEFSRSVYGLNPFPETLELSKYIRENTAPTDTVIVLGSEPQVYAYTRRHAASSYIYTYALMEPTRFAGSMQREMIQEVEGAHPKFMLLVNVAVSWLQNPQSERLILDWASKYSSNYEFVCRADILPSGTNYLWSENEANQTPTPQNFLLLLRRK
jgi:Dolichyl-phosphate-mannose-protein mannosyltransferase